MPGHDPLMDALEAAEVGANFNPIYGYLNKGPINYKWMARIGYYCWSLVFGSEADRQKSRALVVEMLDRFEEFGLFCISRSQCEFFLADPHRNFELYPACVGTLAALKDNDDELAARLFRVVTSDLFYCDHLKFGPQDKIKHPGTRFKEPMPVDKSWGVILIFYREWYGLRHTGNAKDKKHMLWRSRDHACCRILRQYMKQFKSVAKDAELKNYPIPFKIVRTRYEFGDTVEIEHDGHLVDIPNTKESPNQTITDIAVYKDGTLLDYVRMHERPVDAVELGRAIDSYLIE